MKFKKITDTIHYAIETEVLMMLAAHRDCLCFGVMRGLAVLGYGYIGSDTMDGIQENRGGTQKEHNLKWWLRELVNRILIETKYPNSTKEGTYQVLDKYRKLSQCVKKEKVMA